ncbi:MAG: SPOR domain-containing protein [Candidatus Omnitrophota bacterium]
MMDKKEKARQLELFSHPADFPEIEKSGRTFFHNHISLNVEHIIVLSVVILMVVIFSFSLGVERGKKITDIQKTINIQRVEKQAEEKPIVIEVKEEIYKEEEIFTHTIQVASFRNKASVEQEAARLQKKGYETVIMTKGTWVILCVGKFRNKQDAEVLHKELLKKYGDCIIRKI